MKASSLVVAAALTALACVASAQTTVSEPWVRATVPQQKATGAFFKISSTQGGKLVSVSSAAAGVVELHEMKLEGTTMKMAALPSLDLPAGKTIELRPGSYHVMLMDLKAPLTAGNQVDLNLVIEGMDGKRQTVAVKAPVRPLGQAMAGSAPAEHHHHH